MTWLFSFLPSLLGFASKGLDYYMKKADNNTQLALEMMRVDQAANQVRIASMGHPAWWLAWLLFVLPYGLLTAKVIIWDTMLGLGTTPALRGTVAEWGHIVVASIFGGQFALGIVGVIFNRLTGGRA